MHHKFEYMCIHCQKTYQGKQEVHYLCQDCSKTNTDKLPPAGALKVLYAYEEARAFSPNFYTLKMRNFIDILPVSSTKSLPPLRIGQTPLYKYVQSSDSKWPFHVFLKDDSQNPTFSFKDRASALVSAFAKENNLETIVAASTGNAGSSMAGICAAQQQKAIIMTPASAPPAKLSQVLMYGARLVPVNGTYDDAFELSLAATKAFGWYNRNTGYNPLTVEGKKTASLELFDQMEGRIPDRIFVSVGDGVIISGLYKGYEDLLKLGLTDQMPVIVAVQSEKSDNLVRNIKNEHFRAVPASTLADSISVDVPRNFFMARQYINKYDGEGLTVSDAEILKASSALARSSGIFAEPAAAAAFAGLLKYHRMEMLKPGSSNVVMLTGSGLKDLKGIKTVLKMPGPVDCNLDALRRFLN